MELVKTKQKKKSKKKESSPAKTRIKIKPANKVLVFETKNKEPIGFIRRA
jgi:hypothetical protein